MAATAVQRRATWGIVMAAALATLFWQASSDLTARWAGVPPVPRPQTASAMTLGDTQLAYRTGALSLQALGDSGGQVTPLKDYNYPELGAWFALLDHLDPAADHVPMMAAYYFGASRVPADVAVIVDYLARIGNTPVGQKWRWLAYAAYLARHRADNFDRALEIAYQLARLQPVDGKPLPLWARQMPAFILGAQGDTQTARALIEQMLTSSTDLHPNEVNFMKAYLVDQLGADPAEVERVMNLRGRP